MVEKVTFSLPPCQSLVFVDFFFSSRSFHEATFHVDVAVACARAEKQVPYICTRALRLWGPATWPGLRRWCFGY